MLKKKILKKYDEIKNVTYVNGTGGYGNNYKKEVIKNFNLDKTYAQMVMRMSYGDIVNIVKDLEKKES